ncbi:MAG TPA: TetR/AcrR family transcriptional regulator [Pseudonocardia sp.]|jgi:AcrR family transcriptional regulator
MSGDWLRTERAELATERILDAARPLFIERGVAEVGMADIARAVGCSRATLYRYYPDRHSLQVAYANREARLLVRRIVRERAGDEPSDPTERLLDQLIAVLGQVRRTPHLAVWFEPANLRVAAELSRSAEVIEALATGFAGHRAGHRGQLPPAAAQRLGRWTVRILVSLLLLPEASEHEERAMLRDYLLPLLTGRSQSAGSEPSAAAEVVPPQADRR